jgi:hypothetical protein
MEALAFTDTNGGYYGYMWDGVSELPAWAVGLTPCPVLVTVLTAEQTKAHLEASVDRHADAVAKTKGYGRVGVSPSASCIGYSGYQNEFQAEAISFGVWLASLWPVCWAIQADVEAGLRDIPTEEELIMELPIWGI